MRSRVVLMIVGAVALLQTIVVGGPLRELSSEDYSWTLWFPTAAFSLTFVGWVLVWVNDRRRFRENAALMRKLAVRLPRMLYLSGVRAPDRKVRTSDGSLRTRPGPSFKVRLVLRRVRNQRLPGLLIWVPPGLRTSVLTSQLMDEVSQSIAGSRWDFSSYEDRRGDSGRWRFFHLLVLQIEEAPLTSGERTGEEEH